MPDMLVKLYELPDSAPFMTRQADAGITTRRAIPPEKHLVVGWVRRTFGAPYEQKGARAFFQNAGCYVIADLPESPGRCTVRMLPRSEQAEVERMKREADAKAARPPPP